MEKNILNEIKRAREIMGLSSLLNEGVPIKLLTPFEKELVTLAKTEKDVIKGVLKGLESNEIDDALKAIDDFESLSTRGLSPTDDEIKAFNTAVETITNNLDVPRYAQVLKKNDVLGVASSYQKLVQKANEGDMGITTFEQQVDNLLSDRLDQIENPTLRKELQKLYKKTPTGISSEQEIIDDVIRKLETGEDTRGLFEKGKFLGVFEKQKFAEDLSKLRNEARKLVGKMDKAQMIEELEQQASGVLRAIEKRSKTIAPEKLNLIQKFLKKPVRNISIGLALIWLIGCIYGDKTLGYCAVMTAGEQIKGGGEALKDLKKDKSSSGTPSETNKKQTLSADDLPLPGGN